MNRFTRDRKVRVTNSVPHKRQTVAADVARPVRGEFIKSRGNRRLVQPATVLLPAIRGKPYRRRRSVRIWQAILVGLGAILILIMHVRFPRVVELVTAVASLWANLAYLLVVAAMFRRRLRGWPDPDSFEEGRRAFSVGRFGLPINVLALLWSVFMVVS